MRAQLFALLLCAPATAQLISMSFCAPPVSGGYPDCLSSCFNWQATVGQCFPCDSNKGPCSAANPSFITTPQNLMLYNDAACTSPSFGPLPIVVDNVCRSDVTGASYSYRALNMSAVIG